MRRWRWAHAGGLRLQVKEFLKDPGAFIVEAAPEASGGGGGGETAAAAAEEAKPEEEEEEEDDVSPSPLQRPFTNRGPSVVAPVWRPCDAGLLGVPVLKSQHGGYVMLVPLYGCVCLFSHLVRHWGKALLVDTARWQHSLRQMPVADEPKPAGT